MTSAPNKHQQKTEATRRKLLQAALRIFSRDGFERARLEDIAAEAGHTRGAFYANFATKEDLFLALLEQQAAKRCAKIYKALEGTATPESRLDAVRSYYLSLAGDRDWSMLTLEFKLHALRNTKHRAKLAAAHRRIRETFHLELMSRIKQTRETYPATEEHGKVLLDVVWSGLVLEHAYDPRRVSAGEVTTLLGRIFDMVTRNGTRHGKP